MPTGTVCSAALPYIGPCFTVGGALFLAFGILAWARPESPLIRRFVTHLYPAETDSDEISVYLGFTAEHMGFRNLRLVRLMGPLGGGTFLVVGIWMTIDQIRCSLGFH
jgi:hypothetical protein